MKPLMNIDFICYKSINYFILNKIDLEVNNIIYALCIREINPINLNIFKMDILLLFLITKNLIIYRIKIIIS